MLRCERCGGAVAVDPSAGQMVCPACGHRQVAPVLGVVHGYQRRVEGHVQAAQREAERQAVLAPENSPWASRPVMAVFLVGSVLMAGLIVAVIVAHDRGVKLDKALLNLTAVGIFVLVTVGALVAYFATRPRIAAPSLASTLRIACPSCGAPGSLVPGEGVADCRYCRGALVPTPTVMQQGIDHAARAHREARRARDRVERRARVRADRLRHPLPVQALWMAVTALLVAPAAVVSGRIALGHGGLDWFGGATLLFGATAMIVGLSIVVRTTLGQRARRRVIDELAREFQGRRCIGSDGWLDWLDRHWLGEFDADEISESRYGCAASLSVYGYPMLVLADPTFALGPRRGRVEVLVSLGVDAPMRPPGRDGVEALQWLDAQGFAVRPDEGGLRACATDVAVRAWARDPDAARWLARVVGTLAVVARSLSSS